MTNAQLMLLMILIPVIIAIIIMAIPKDNKVVKSVLTMVAVLLNLVLAIFLFRTTDTLVMAWGGFGIDFSLKIDNLSGFILLMAAGFALLIGLYSISFLQGKVFEKQFYLYFLITLGMVNGAVMANNLVMLLFFWEGLLVTLFGMIMLGNANYKTAVKAVTLNGVADLLLMLGIAITVWQAGTAAMDMIKPIPLEGVAILGFICMMLGAIGKAGSMPFHSWIPDAGTDATLPFMAFMPAAIEKLLGIYLLARITLNFYDLQPGTAMSKLMMIIGVVTIILAVGMALIQKDYKKLLSYHAISQLGYMVLGIGTALPVGIVGGLFHMINHAVYKSCLFLTAGSVERQTGTTDLRKLRGLGKVMPVTTVCFLIAAASIAGVPPFNGFFSKELIFDAALETGMIYYLGALLGAFLTAASFLKLGHTVYFGATKPNLKNTKEAPGAMLTSMICLAFVCVLFGVYNPLPLRGFIQPILGNRMAGHDFAGLPHSWILVAISLLVLALAVLNHVWGTKRTGDSLKSVDHIHYAPILHQTYNLAEQGYFDPFNILMFFLNGFAWVCTAIDKCLNWVYDVFLVAVHKTIAVGLKDINNGTKQFSVSLALFGLVFVVIVFVALV